MVIRAATGSVALQLMSDCCARGETNTAQLRWQPHCDCLTLCLVFVVNMLTEGRASSGVASLLVVSSLHVFFTLHHSEMFALLCSSECEAEVFCVPAELLLHPASLLSVI